MLNKKAQATLLIGVAILIVIGIVFFYVSGKVGFFDFGGSNEGRVVVVITDAATNLEGVTKVVVTIDSITAHMSGEDGAWILISALSNDYDLLALKAAGELAVAADATVIASNYDQFRMHISKVVVTDENGEHEAKLPSNELKMDADLTVDENSTATAKFDFILDESLHVTGNNTYILAPVIKIETRSNSNVQIASNNKAVISGGSVKTTTKVGMDAEGRIGVGLGIPANAKVAIGSDGKISLFDDTD